MRAALDNLISPPVLFFALGCVAAALKTDLKLPKSFTQVLAIYIMTAIGYKGGVELNKSGIGAQAALSVLAGITLSGSVPLIAYAILRRIKNLKQIDAANIAAHYGSVSLITFVVTVEFYAQAGDPASGYMAAVLALMEVPALALGIILARSHKSGLKQTLGHALGSGTLLILIGSLIIGLILGEDGSQSIQGFLTIPFTGVVCFFLFATALSAFEQAAELKRLGWMLVSFALYMPIIGASLGLGVGVAMGLPVADTALLATMSASASYIAAPAAMRIALPEANMALALPMAIMITFPFNLVIGIPLYLEAARLISG